MNTVTDYVTTAKLRALVKKLDIPYVDAVRANHSSIANGIHIWQIGNTISFRTFNDPDKIYVGKFHAALKEQGLTIRMVFNMFGSLNHTYDVILAESVSA